ncbi:MAG: biotin/lipoyl-binding protein, partial [Burkholderiales bacterium]
MKRLTMLLIFAVIGAVAGGAYWYWNQQANGTATEGQQKGKGKGKGKGSGGVLTVRAARAVVKPMPVLIEAVGTVEPEHSVQVRAQISGVLKAVYFKEGDKVNAGQALFLIDPATSQAQY